MWFKSTLSYSHRLHKLQDNLAARLFAEELQESDEDRIPASTPEYTHSFATKIREAEEKLGLVHDQHFSSLQLKEAAALDLLKRMDDEHPHSPFLSNFDLDTEHPTRPDHHLRADPPAVIALRSRLRLDSTLLNSPLHKRKMKASPKCEHCGQPETIKHVILSCSQYDSARSDLFAALGFRPPDNHLMEICLGRTSDRKLKGRKSTAYERASASFLLEIDRLRPHLWRFPFQLSISDISFDHSPSPSYPELRFTMYAPCMSALLDVSRSWVYTLFTPLVKKEKRREEKRREEKRREGLQRKFRCGGTDSQNSFTFESFGWLFLAFSFLFSFDIVKFKKVCRKSLKFCCLFFPPCFDCLCLLFWNLTVVFLLFFWFFSQSQSNLQVWISAVHKSHFFCTASATSLFCSLKKAPQNFLFFCTPFWIWQ